MGVRKAGRAKRFGSSAKLWSGIVADTIRPSLSTRGGTEVPENVRLSYGVDVTRDAARRSQGFLSALKLLRSAGVSL